MKGTAILLTAFVALAVRGELSRIDADGVTETGGGTNYARMLTRTGTNGLLSATLLPPVADWASQPIARLYYAAAGATVQGNGSPQYPFNDLTYALSHMAADSALLLAPGNYSGTGTVASGRTITLFGVGGQSRVTVLSVSAGGSSAYTTLDLCGLEVDTLRVGGGRVNIRLSATRIGTLEGDASSVTVTRTDMGSRIGASTLTHVDTYTGYRFAPEAGAVVSHDGAHAITLYGARGVVVDGSTTNTIAHVSDVTAATVALNAAMADLRSADAALSGAVSAERTARADADTALSNNLTRVISELSGDVNAIGTRWNTSLEAINSRITDVNMALSSLESRHSSDLATVNSAVAQVNSAYAAADSSLNSALRSLIASSVSDLRSDVPDIADERAAVVVDARLGATTNSVISAAVARANADAVARERVISNKVASVQGNLTALQSTVDGHTTVLGNLISADSTIQGQISSVASRVSTLESRVSSLESAVSALQTWRNGVDTWKTTTDSNISTVKSRINSIIDSITPLTNSYHRAIVLPSKF